MGSSGYAATSSSKHSMTAARRTAADDADQRGQVAPRGACGRQGVSERMRAHRERWHRHAEVHAVKVYVSTGGQISVYILCATLARWTCPCYGQTPRSKGRDGKIFRGKASENVFERGAHQRDSRSQFRRRARALLARAGSESQSLPHSLTNPLPHKESYRCARAHRHAFVRSAATPLPRREPNVGLWLRCECWLLGAP